MAKLYFKYGAMGSSKTAQALITKFNYEERGMKVWLIKPSVDERDGVFTVKSRIGLTAEGTAISETCNIYEEMKNRPEHADVIIADEAQFFSREQIDELRDIVDELNVPVLCFGLRTDFLTHVFPGSGRLLEIADEFSEIKPMCESDRKATVNARIDGNGKIVTDGAQIFLGGNDSYVAMCYSCWKKKIKEQNKSENLG